MIVKHLGGCLLFAAVTFFGCSTPPGADSYLAPSLLRASIEGASPRTKTSYDSDGPAGEFLWSAGDKITLHYASSGWRSYDVDFETGNVYAAPSNPYNYRNYYAVYPASVAPRIEGLDLVDPPLYLTLPSSYDISDIVSGSSSERTADFSPCPMVANNDMYSDLLQFYHTGGLLRLTLLSVNPAASKVTVTFETDVASEFLVNNPKTSTPEIVVGNESLQANPTNTVSFTLSAGAGIGSAHGPVVLNIPLPCGAVGRFRVEAFGGNNLSLGAVDVNYPLTVTRRYGKKFWILFSQTLDGSVEGIYWTDNKNEVEDLVWENRVNRIENLIWE